MSKCSKEGGDVFMPLYSVPVSKNPAVTEQNRLVFLRGFSEKFV